jgi:hypothetical protein
MPATYLSLQSQSILDSVQLFANLCLNYPLCCYFVPNLVRNP